MTSTVLVTGATGTVGRHVVPALVERDATVRAGVRDPENAPSQLADDRRVSTVAFDFERPETWGSALDGVDAVFLLRPPTVATAEVTGFVDALGRVGVDRVGYLSTLGADRNVLVPHHRIEKRLAAAGVPATFLRASFFSQNLLEVHREDIVARAEVFVPAGDGATSFVDARDVAEAAAVVLTEAGHAGRAYDLTGSEAIDYHEVARVFSDVLDRQVTYPRPSLVAFARHRRRQGDPLRYVLLMAGIYTTARLGLADRVSDDLERLLGREPLTMRDFVEDHADDFRACGGCDAGPDGSAVGAPRRCRPTLATRSRRRACRGSRSGGRSTPRRRRAAIRDWTRRASSRRATRSTGSAG
jgi:uncharacterized protein YbjT (DUF2867 family)